MTQETTCQAYTASAGHQALFSGLVVLHLAFLRVDTLCQSACNWQGEQFVIQGPFEVVLKGF